VNGRLVTRVERSASLQRARRAAGEHKRALVLAAVDAELHRGRYPSIAGVARRAGVGRKFIYDHPDLKADIELKLAQATSRLAGDMVASARVTGASLRADLENSRAEAQRLRRQLAAAESRLSRTEGARLLADDLLPDNLAAELADTRLAQRLADTEQQLFQARESLRVTTEELEAARAINRELMQRANRPAGGPGESR